MQPGKQRAVFFSKYIIFSYGRQIAIADIEMNIYTLQ